MVADELTKHLIIGLVAAFFTGKVVDAKKAQENSKGRKTYAQQALSCTKIAQRLITAYFLGNIPTIHGAEMALAATSTTTTTTTAMQTFADYDYDYDTASIQSFAVHYVIIAVTLLIVLMSIIFANFDWIVELFSSPVVIGAEDFVDDDMDDDAKYHRHCIWAASNPIIPTEVPIPTKLRCAEDPLDSIPMPIQLMASAPKEEPRVEPASKEEHPQWPATRGPVHRRTDTGTQTKDCSWTNIMVQTDTHTVLTHTLGTQSETALCRNACVQAQTTYTAVRGVQVPRFQPLPDSSHGCFRG